MNMQQTCSYASMPACTELHSASNPMPCRVRATCLCCARRRFDRCICLYDMDKLDKPKEAFKRVKDCGKAGLTSLAFDPHNNVLLAGSLDGILRVWSVEGRCVCALPAH